jgi:MFS transporter, BCD family, chlorophyll transporter
MRDTVSSIALRGDLGIALQQNATGYSVVYHTEILLLFITLLALGPLVRVRIQTSQSLPNAKFGLVQHPV